MGLPSEPPENGNGAAGKLAVAVACEAIIRMKVIDAAGTRRNGQYDNESERKKCR
jgi:hypothetical protein